MISLLKQHIALKCIAVLLASALLAPLAFKLVHSCEHDEHALCDAGNGENFHHCEIDCPLLKYNFQYYYFNYESFQINQCFLDSFEIPTLAYGFISNHRQVTLSLRGPPFS